MKTTMRMKVRWVSIGPRVSRGWWLEVEEMERLLGIRVSIGPRVSRGWWRCLIPENDGG